MTVDDGKKKNKKKSKEKVEVVGRGGVYIDG